MTSIPYSEPAVRARSDANAAPDAANVPSVDAGLALLRIIVGLVFVAHGAQKFFVFGLDGVAASFGQMGVPLAGIVGPLVAAGEFFGGAALMVGLLTRFAGAGLAAIMLGALFTVHLANGFFLPSGIEFVLTLFATAAALALTGPGRYSADHLIAHRKEV